MAKGKNGHAVDSAGNAVADPSINVGALVEAEGRRQDDLRLAEARRQDDLRLAAKELADVNSKHLQEIATLRDTHSTAMQAKESSRVDSLRQGDREETTRATVGAQANIQTLATTTTQLADTLRSKEAITTAEVNKHFAEIDRSLSEGKGKQGVADPANERLAQAVEKLVAAQQTGVGEKAGMTDTVKLIIGLLTLVSLYLGFTAASHGSTTATQPQIVYVPVPPGTGTQPLAPATPK